MEGAALEIGEVLERLTHVIAAGAPALWASLRPPVSESDLNGLRRAVDPYELPSELVALLRWANGQHSGPWWPSIHCGPLLGAAAAAETYESQLSNWSKAATRSDDWRWAPLWVPVAGEGLACAGLEMTPDRPGVVVDGSLPDGDAVVLAPSLAVMLDATATMIEHQIPVTEPEGPGRFVRWLADRAAIIDAYPDWQAWPYDRLPAPHPEAWPPHWRVSIGLPAVSDAERRPTITIAAAMTNDSGSSEGQPTIEGVVIDRELPEGTAEGLAILTLADASGTLRIAVPRSTPGLFWASTKGRRVQVDLAEIGAQELVNGASADATASAIRFGVQTHD